MRRMLAPAAVLAVLVGGFLTLPAAAGGGGAATAAAPTKALPTKAGALFPGLLPEFVKAHHKFRRGAKPTPRHKLLKAPQHRVRAAVPPQYGVLPKRLSFWGNNVDGNCTVAEEAAAKAFWSVACGLPETFMPDQTVLAWGARFGFNDGATLTDPMDKMAQYGMTAEDGKTYLDGPYTSVDYSTETVLQSAIASGPVKIGIDANALPSGAGNQTGWYDFGGSPGQYTSEDHCVGVYAYGPAAFMFQLVGQPVPAGVSPTKTYYGLYTWSTLGVVDHEWLMSTCGEAWVRTPCTPGQTPAPVPPAPPGPTPPVPPAPPAGPAYTVTVTGQIPRHGLFGGSDTVTLTGTATPAAQPAPARAGEKPSLSLDVVFALIQFAADVQASSNGTLKTDLQAVLTAIKSGTGVLPALEQMGMDLVAAGADPRVLADLVRIGTDLGVQIPQTSPLKTGKPCCGQSTPAPVPARDGKRSSLPVPALAC